MYAGARFGVMRLGILCVIPVLASFFATGCKTTGSGNDDGPQVERQEMTVEIEDASGEQTGETVTIDYPVLVDKNDRIPKWVINPAMGGVVGAVGVSIAKGLGTREQLDEARLSGRLELATMLEARVQNVGRGELEEDIRATNDGREDQSRKNALGVDREILDIVLAGSRQRALWFDPENNECFVWMVLDGAILTKVKHYVEGGVSVFIADAPIKHEYKPERSKPVVPKVVVEAAEPPPPPPKEPIEKLEEKLKPIETIPLKVEE